MTLIDPGLHRFRADLWAVWCSASGVPREVGNAVKVTAEGFLGVLVAFLQSLLARLTGTPAERVTSRVRRGWANAPRVCILMPGISRGKMSKGASRMHSVHSSRKLS